MIDKDIMREALIESGINQSKLAEMMKVNRTTISSTIHRDNMGVDVFVKYMNALGYDVVVGKNGEDGFDKKWDVTPGNADMRANRNRK